MSMASIIAVQSSEHAKLLSRAMTIGQQLSKIMYEVLSKYLQLEDVDESGKMTKTSHHELSEEEIQIRQAWQTGASITGHVAAMIVTYVFRKISFIMTSCSLGAELVTSAIQQLLDPVLIQNKWPPIKDITICNVNPANALHMALFSYGLLQLTHRSSLLERILFLPLTTVETFLSVLVFTKKI